MGVVLEGAPHGAVPLSKFPESGCGGVEGHCNLQDSEAPCQKSLENRLNALRHEGSVSEMNRDETNY